MAFRKRNQPLTRTPPTSSSSSATSTTFAPSASPTNTISQTPPPTRTHPTGTPSLDTLLSLPTSYTATSGPGLALGTSLLIEETGTTDYAGVLARCYAAEGVVRGECLHIVGVGRGWDRGLPGLVGPGDEGGARTREGEKWDGKGKEVEARMKIAWRYQVGERASTAARERQQPTNPTSPSTSATSSSASGTPLHDAPSTTTKRSSHIFDLTKRLDLPPNTQIQHHALPPPDQPLTTLHQTLSSHLAQAPPQTTHRLIIPSLLSPAIPYSPTTAHPAQIIPFMHGLRALLRRYPTTLSALLTLPLDLYPRASALTRSIELCVDGVLELSPFPHRLSACAPVSVSASDSSSGGGVDKRGEEEPQGLVRVHKLPILEERGGGRGGGGAGGDDMAFVVSRRRFDLRPYSLPPEEWDREAQQQQQQGGEGAKGMPDKKDIEF